MEEVERLKEEEKKEKDETMENVFKQTTTEFTEAFKRLLTNKLFMYNFFSSLVSDQFNLTFPTVSFFYHFCYSCVFTWGYNKEFKKMNFTIMKREDFTFWPFFSSTCSRSWVSERSCRSTSSTSSGRRDRPRLHSPEVWGQFQKLSGCW
jgi:hypothetical protein